MQTRTVPTVSVIMPAYNAEKYLREAIDSILAQTYTDFEFIIINDGSTDRTREIILSYDDPRIIYLENEHNSGICITLNRGLDAARGRYIARMDADDISLPQRFAKQVAYLDAHPEVGVLGTDIEVFGEDIATYTFTQLHTPEECQAGLLFNSCFAHPTVMMRKTVLDANNLRYNDNFRGLEDYELWWQTSKYTKLNNLAAPLLRYRHHTGQETRNVSPRVRAAFEVFASLRMKDLGINLSESDLQLLLNYSNGEYDKIAAENFNKYLSIFKTILKAYSAKADSRLYRAAKYTIAQAITNIIMRSSLMTKSQSLYNLAWNKGLFPTIWYMKVTYNNLRR